MQVLWNCEHLCQSQHSWLFVVMLLFFKDSCWGHIPAQTVLKISQKKSHGSVQKWHCRSTRNFSRKLATPISKHTHTQSFVENMVRMRERRRSMWKGRGGSSLPERCYSGPHASASVSANERNPALFHLVSLDRELASPKTDAARMDRGREERGRKTEGGSWKNRKEGAKTWRNNGKVTEKDGKRRRDEVPRLGRWTKTLSLTHMLRHIELSEVTESETALNRSLMDPQDERPAI